MLNCPNRNDQDWKNLVNAVGESTAFDIYANLNGNYPKIGLTINGEIDPIYTNLVSDFGDKIASKIWFDQFTIDKNFSVDTTYESSPYYSDKLSLGQQLSIVSNIAYNINSNLVKGEKVKSNDILDKWNNYFADIKNIEITDPNIKLKRDQTVDNILNSWGVISNLVKIKLASLQGVSIQNIKTKDEFSDNISTQDLNLDDDGLGDTNSNQERTNFNDDWTLFLDGKNTMSGDLKRLLSIVRDLDENGNTKADIFQTIKLIPFDKVYNSIIPLLTDVKPNLIAMTNALQANIIAMPYLKDVIDILNSASIQLKNEFISNASNHYVRMQYLGWTPDSYEVHGSEINTYRMIPTNTNTNDIAYVISNKWNNNLINTDLIYQKSEEDATLNYNTDKVKEIITNINDLQKLLNRKEQEPKLKELFDSIGIKLSPQTIDQFLAHGYRHTGTRIQYKEQFTSGKGIFKILKDRLEKIVKESDSNFQDYNLFDDQVFKVLSKLEASKSLSDFSNSHTRGDNKIIFSYERNKYFTDRINELKSSDYLKDNLSKIGFSSTSKWLEFLKDSTSEGYNNFNYFYADTLTKFGQKKISAVTLAESTPTDHEVYRLGMFMNRGTETSKGIRFGNVLFPTMSDGTAMFGVSTILHNTQMIENDLAPSTVEALYQSLVASELKRIIRYKENGKTLNIENYDKGATKFIMLPTLNKVFGKTIGDRTTRDSDYNEKEIEFKKQAYVEINKYVKSLVNTRLEDWIKLGVLSPRNEKEDNGLKSIKYKDITYTMHFLDNDYQNKILKNIVKTNKVVFTAHDLEVNYLLAKAEFHQLIIGDPALYYKSGKDDVDSTRLTFDNISKRLAGDRAPGISLADSDNNQFIQLFAKDRDAFSINQALEEVEAYRKFKSTDAQEFTTLREHLYIMSKIGKIESEDINSLISKANKGTLSEEELGLIFQPIKPVNVQHIENVEDDISHRYYIKSSSYPLIKQLTQGLEIDKLRVKMEELENDKVRNPKGLTVRLAFGSAVKIGNVSNPISIYDNKTGNILDNLNFDNSFAELNRSGFKIQQDIPYDEDHDHINVVSQASVLIFNNILNETFTYQGKELKGSDLQKIYFDKYGSIYKQKLDQLLKDLEWNGKTINIAKLKEILDSEVQGRNFNINAVAGLTINNEEFTHRLTFNPNISKYESVLNSIVDNRVRKLKMPGSSFILSTEEGYKDKAKVKGEEEIVKHPGIIFTKEWNGQLQSNQIIIPNRFKDHNGNLIDFTEKDTKGKYIWLDETKDGLRLNDRVDSELLKMLGFRIPNQGHSSMTAPNIVGFLPKASGDLVIASRDLVVQMGSDFDIDKLYAYLYNNIFEYSRQEDKTQYDPYLIKYTSDKENEKTLQNDIIDIYHNILRSGNAKVDSLQYKPLDSEHIKNIADEIYNLRQEKLGVNEYFTPMSSTYDRNTFFENRDGKNGVAIFSALSVLNANLQGKAIAYGKNLQTEDGMKFLPTEIVFGNQRSTIFSDEKTTSNYDFTKSDVISWDQSESVDNSKNKRLSKLNLNTDTFNAKLALNLFGFVDEGYWFLNQDIIYDYINEQNKLRGAGSTSFDKDAAYKAVLQKYQDLAIINGDRVFNFEEDSDAKDYQKLANENLSLDLMKQLISKEGTKIENYATIQLAILDKFRDLDQIGIGVKQLISAVNTNSKGLGVSIMENINKEEKIAKLADSVVFQNATSLIGEYITPTQYADLGMPEEYHITRNRTDGTVWYIKPTTINGYASIYSINTANKIYSEYFSDYFNRYLNQFMTKIIEISGKDSEVSAKSVAKIKQDIFNSYKSYVYTNKELGLSENPNEDRKRLLYDIWTKNKHTQKSLATTIQEISNTKLGILNPFLNKLNVDIKRGEAPSTITYTASSAENLDEIDIHIGILDLIRNDRQIEGTNYTTKQLVNDLVKYAYLTGGKQNFTSFLKFIPDEYLNELGFNQKIKDYRINSGDLNELNYSELHPFVQQYFQHNTNSVKTIKGTDLISDFTKQIGDNFVIKPESLDKYKVVRNVPIGEGRTAMREVAPELLSYYKNKNQYLFKLTQTDEKGDFYIDGNTHYVRIATLGTSGLNEYSEGEKDARSSIPDQNPKYKVNTNPAPIKEEIPKQVGRVIANRTVSEQYGFTKNKMSGEDIKEILSNIKNNKESQLNSFVADEFLKAIKRNNIKLDFVKDENLEAAGKFDNDHTIYFNTNSINKNSNNFRYFVLHELTHALTWYAAKNSESPEDNKAVRRLRGIFNEVIKILGEDKINELKTKLSKQYKESELMAVSSKEEFLLYGGVNLQEMLALTMNSPEFQKILNDIPYKGEDKSFWKELFDRIMEVLKTIGIKINKGSALHYAMNDIISLANRETEFGDSENKVNKEEIPEKFQDKQVKNIVQKKPEAMYSPDMELDSPIELSTRNKVLINEQYRRIQIIKKELALSNVKSDSKRTDELRQEIINIQSKIEDIKEINSLYQITALAEIDLKEADEDLKNKLTDSDIIRIRSKIELWKHGIRELLTDDEANSEVVRMGNIQDGGDFKGYEYYQNWAIRLEDKLIKIEEEHIQNFIKEQRGEDTTVKKIFDNQKDIMALKEYGLDISHTENAIIQSIDKQTKTFGLEAQDEIAKKIRLIDQTTALARPELEQIRRPNTNLFDSFKQYTKEGLETGRILSPYSHEYYKTISDLYYKASAINSQSDWKEYHKFKQENEILFDFRKLFSDQELYNEETFNEQDKIDHINELKSHLGERAFNKLYSTLHNKYELFKSAYESAKNRINSYTDLSEADKAREIDIWNKTNSPYWASKMVDSFDTIYKTSKTIIHNNASWNYTYSVPRRTDVKGEETNWYDKNFDVINNSEKLYNFYEVLVDTLDELNSYLPSDEQQSMKGNAIPTIKKSVYEIFTESGLKNGSVAFMDSVISQLTDREASDVLYANINPETHEVEKELRANFITNNIDEINAIVNQKSIQHVIDYNGNNPTHEDELRFKNEAIDEISKKRSFDLPKIIKMYASLVHTYRYKAQVEDIMKIADNIIQRAVETQKNREGVPLTNANTGQLITKPVDKSFKHIKGQWDYYIQNFYGKRYQQESIIEHIKKHYTSEEKQQIENLDQMAIRIEELFEKGAITQSTYSSIKDEIQSQIEKLGGVIVDSKVGREFLRFIQLKGMGWNLFSGIGNVSFGFISNTIEASGGRIFNSSEIRKAYGLTMGSMLKNYTFDKVELPTAIKIKSLMDKWDILGDVANELYKRTETSVMSDRMKWLNAYAIQQRSEYMNQAPLMIAILMHMKHNSSIGEIELWEGFDTEGNWNTEKYGEEPKDLISKARLRMKQTSKRLHGNYYTDSPLKINDKFITTALRQFRTWMFESFNNRFENEHYDDLLGLTVKGRYNTFYQSLFSANKIGQTSGMSNTIFTIQQLLRKLIGMKTKFDDRFNEVDAANMRMNMTELVMYGTLAMLMLAIRASANGDDDKKKRDQLMANYLLNIGIRLQTDITFYTNPMSFSALTQNAIPCATVIQDYYKWMKATGQLMIGDDTIKTGVYAGSSRWLRDSSNLLPFFAQVRKTIATSIQVIKN